MDAYVFLRTSTQRARAVADDIAGMTDLPGVRQVGVVTGDWDAVVAVEADDLGEIESTVVRGIHGREDVVETQTALALPLGRLTERARGLLGPVRGREATTVLVLAKLDLEPASRHPQGWRSWLGSFTDALQEIPGVQGAAMVTGEHDLIVEVGGETWDDCAEGILGVAMLEGVVATTTHVLTSGKLKPPG